MHNLETTRLHIKTYRPTFLVLTGNPEERPALIHFANMLRKGASVGRCRTVDWSMAVLRAQARAE